MVRQRQADFRHRQTDRERKTVTDTYREEDRQTERKTDREEDRQTERKTDANNKEKQARQVTGSHTKANKQTERE